MPGQTSPHGRSGFANSIEDWMAKRNAVVQQLAAGAHAAGQQVWADGNRLRQYVPAARPSDVAALGIRAMQKTAVAGGRIAAEATDAMARQVAAVSPEVKRIASSVRDEGLAGLNGAQDAFTFGVGDRAYAGVRALADAAQGDDLVRSYSRHYAGTQALDAYDEARHPIARTLGQAAGTVAQIALAGAGEGAIIGRTIKQATPMIAREIAAIGGAGGVAGLGGQALSDATQGRQGSVADYAGAALGGTLGAYLAARGRASDGAALAGGATSLSQDFLNGRPLSFDRARRAAATGAALGAATGSLGRAWSDGLTPYQKGQLGEDLSRIRTWARGDNTAYGPKTKLDLSDGGYTIPDSLTAGGETVELKFGPFARLSPRQRQAYMQPLPGYRVDQFLPQDVGSAVGYPIGLFGTSAVSADDQQGW